MRDREQHIVLVLLARSQFEVLAECEHRFLIHDRSKCIVNSVAQLPNFCKPVTKDARSTALMGNIRRTSEVESTPFRSISLLSEEFFIASLDSPSLELGAVFLASFVQIPFDARTAIAAYPLAYS